MPVVNRNGVIEDAWIALADDAAAPAGSHVVVSLARLKNEHNALFAAAGSVGVEIMGDVDLDELKPLLSGLGLVVIRFSSMRDGRPFSAGRLLRDRYGFTGDMRAAGDFIPDQALFLLRCGFTSFQVGADFSLEALKRSIAAYSAWYQRSNDRASTVVDLRHGSDTAPNGSKP